MKILFSLCFIFCLSVNNSAQHSLDCPSDLTVHIHNLDLNYSYGDPVPTSNADYIIEKEIYVESTGCDGSDIMQITSLTYSMIENGT